MTLASPSCLMASYASVPAEAALLPLSLAARSRHSVASMDMSAMSERKSSSSRSVPRTKVCRRRSRDDRPDASWTRVMRLAEDVLDLIRADAATVDILLA